MIRPRVLTSVFAVLYAVICTFIVFYLGVRPSLSIDFLFGTYWVRRFIIPAVFWVFTATYSKFAPDAEPRIGRLRKGVALGLTFHLALLFAQFLRLHESAELPSVTFTAYTNCVAAAFLIGCSVYGLAQWRTADTADGFRAPFLIAPALLPLLIGPKYGLFVLLVSALLHWKRADLRAVGERTRKILERPFSFPVLLFVIALLFRATAAARLGQMGLNTVLLNSDDAQQYYAYSDWVHAGKWIPLWYSIGTTGWVTFLRWASFDHLVLNLLIQSAFLSGIPVIIFLIGRRAFDSATGVLAGLLCAMSQLLIFNSANWTREGIGALALCIAMLTLLKMIEQKNKRFTVLSGIAIGLLITIDPVFSAGFALFYIAWALRGWGNLRLRNLVKGAITCVTAMLLIAGVRWYLHGTPGLRLREYSGSAGELYAGYNQYAKILYERGVNFIDFPRTSLPNLFSSFDNLQLWFAKIWLDLSRYLFESQSGQFDPLLLKRNSILSGNLSFYAYLSSGIGFVAGIGLLKRTDPDRLLAARVLVYLISIAHASVYCILIFGFTRFRAGVQPLFHLYLAFGATTTYAWLRGRADQSSEARLTKA